METSSAGRAAIMQREGVRLKAYRDSVGVWTIGCGHTGRASPPMVVEGMTITMAQAEEFLANDLVEIELPARRAIKVPVTQAEWDAMVSLAFNIGPSAFTGSTLVRKLNAGDLAGAADAFLSWDKAGGQVLPGLQKRRQAERAQFLTYQQPKTPNPREPAPVAPKPSKSGAGAAAAGAVVVAAGSTAAATGGHPAAIAVSALAVLALIVFLVLHFRKG